MRRGGGGRKAVTCASLISSSEIFIGRAARSAAMIGAQRLGSSEKG